MQRLKGLYLVVDRRLGSRGLEAAEAALRGGVDIVQLLHCEEGMEEWARKLRKMTRIHHIPFVMNRDVSLASKVQADGVHIDSQEPSPSEVRDRLGAGKLVGYTCGAQLDKVRWADENGADYVSFCSIFPSGTTGECEIVPLEIVAEARRITKLPIFASGGITHENVGKVLAAGVDGIAVVSAVLTAPDPEQSARRFKSLLNWGPTGENGEEEPVSLYGRRQ